jgi:four helix bundle protein
LDFLTLADEVKEHLPRGRGHLADQLTRASTSIVLNIAEGSDKFSRPDKRRYYLSASGSATESAAILDVCLRLKLIDAYQHETGKAMLDRIVSMLIKLAKRWTWIDRGRERERVCSPDGQASCSLLSFKLRA